MWLVGAGVGTGDVLHCQPSSMTFAVVVVPLPLRPARAWVALCRRQTIRASQLHRHVVMSSIRAGRSFLPLARHVVRLVRTLYVVAPNTALALAPCVQMCCPVRCPVPPVAHFVMRSLVNTLS